MAKKTKATEAATVSTIRNPFPPAKVAPLTLEQRAQLGDKEAKAALEERAKKGDANAAKALAKPAKADAPKKSKPAGERRMGCLAAAAQILRSAKEPLTPKAMIEKMSAKGLWKSPGGKTPQATLYAAILREIQTKGAEARFTKTERGHFALATGTNVPAKPAAKATGKKAAKKKTDQAEIADGTPGPKAVSELFKI